MIRLSEPVERLDLTRSLVNNGIKGTTHRACVRVLVELREEDGKEAREGGRLVNSGGYRADCKAEKVLIVGGGRKRRV